MAAGRSKAQRGVAVGPIRLGALAVLLVAVAARAVVLSQAAETPYFANPILDAETNWGTARLWAWGEGPTTPLFKAPLYPWALGQMARALRSGDRGETEIIAAIIVVQHLLGTAAVGGAMWLTATLAGWGAGICAGLALALAGAMIFFEGDLLDAALVSALLVAAVIPLAGSSPPLRGWRLLAGGLALGLATITRPTCLGVVLVAAVWCAVVHRRQPGGWPGALGRAALLTLPVVFLIGLVCVHNGGQTLIATYGGPNFWLANRPEADGHTTRVPQTHGAPRAGEDYIERFALREAAALMGQESVSPTQAERFWWKEGLRFWREQPGEALAATARRALLFWQGPEIKNNKSLPFVGSQIPALGVLLATVNWLWLAPLGLVGLALGARCHRPGMGPGLTLVALTVLAIFLAGLPFPVNSRYRLPALPFLCVGAGIGVTALAQTLRDRHWHRLLVAGVWLLGLFFVARFDWTRRDLTERAHDWWQLGNLAVTTAEQSGRGEDLALAERAYTQAIALHPEHLESHVNLARLWMMRGENSSARRKLEDVLTRAPDYAVAWSLLGQAALFDSDRGGAESALRRALEIDPGLWPAAKWLTRNLLETGRAPEAAAVLNPFVDQVPEDPEVWVELAWIRAEQGDLVGARIALGRAEGLEPGLAEQRLPPSILTRLRPPP